MSDKKSPEWIDWNIIQLNNLSEQEKVVLSETNKHVKSINLQSMQIIAPDTVSDERIWELIYHLSNISESVWAWELEILHVTETKKY